MLPNIIKPIGKAMKGVGVHHHKNTQDKETVVMPVPDRVYLPLIQHMGAPCTPLVKAGDEVKLGQIIANSDRPFSAPIHASVSGKVKAMEDIINPMGVRTQSIVIEADKLQTVSDTVAPPVVNNSSEFVAAIRASGLVGLGGAGFPTHIKLAPREPDKIDTLVINIAECEPYITSDYRNCMENGKDIIDGVNLVKKYVGKIKQVYIGIEDNKPKAIEYLAKLAEKYSDIKVVSFKSQYPKGAEKVLIFESTVLPVEDGKIPADVGVIVLNGTTVAFIAQYMKTGMPLVSKRITVDGGAVAKPQNVLVPIGTRFVDVINFCGGYTKPARKILMGGPMMGIAVYDDTYSVLKNNNAVLCFDETQAKNIFETECIKCGRCVRTCPFGLMPASIDRAFTAQDVDQLKALNVQRCMECGCCAYACPAKKQLVLTHRMAKAFLRNVK